MVTALEKKKRKDRRANSYNTSHPKQQKTNQDSWLQLLLVQLLLLRAELIHTHG